MTTALRSTLASHILDVASNLFFRIGIRAVGMDRIIQKAGNPAFRACAFGLAAAEHGESARIVARADLAQPDRIGAHLALLYDGALARPAVHGGGTPMLEAKACALALFDQAAQKTHKGRTKE